MSRIPLLTAAAGGELGHEEALCRLVAVGIAEDGSSGDGRVGEDKEGIGMVRSGAFHSGNTIIHEDFPTIQTIQTRSSPHGDSHGFFRQVAMHFFMSLGGKEGPEAR